MSRFLIIVVILVGVYSVAAQDLKNNLTQRDRVAAETAKNITVETEMNGSKTVNEMLGQGREAGEGRTFALRKMQLILLPLMYKFGVMSTLLVLLFGISVKILFITMILLFIKVSSILTKFHHHEVPHHEISWSPPPPQPLFIHLHQTEAHGPHEYHHREDHEDHHVTHEPHHVSHDPHSPNDHHAQEMAYSGWEYPPSAPGPYEKMGAMDKLGQYVVYKG